MQAPRAGKVVAHRILGEGGYTALQTRYWRRRVSRLRYPFEFRDDIDCRSVSLALENECHHRRTPL